MEYFKKILKFTQLGLKKHLYKEVIKLYKEEDIINHSKFLYVKGELPILLLAHLDTVHSQLVKTILYDQEQNLMWSPEGIGGDDRCGVYAILSLLKKGYKPFVLFTTDEEIGGYGAKAFVAYDKENNLELVDKIKYIVQLDRKGQKDSVYYNCNNKSFKTYIDKFGFEEDSGSFSDISIIAPYFKIAAVNLSIGYYNEHRLYEYINLNHMYETMNKVENLILDIENSCYYEYRTNLCDNVNDELMTYYNQLYERSQKLKITNVSLDEYPLFKKELNKKDKD